MTGPRERLPRPLGDSLVGSVASEFIIAGDPTTKARARVRDGHAYTPRRTREAEEAIRWELRARRITPDLDHWLEVHARFLTSTRQRRDLDNLLKLLLDACNGFAWGDDVQVTEIHAARELAVPDPRVEVVVVRLGRYTIDCRTCGAPIRQRGPKTGYCSRTCYDYDAAQRIGPTIPCPGCETPVYRSPSRVEPGRQPWCPDCKGDRRQRKICKRGHRLEGDNILIRADGARLCRTCSDMRVARQRAKRATR